MVIDDTPRIENRSWKSGGLKPWKSPPCNPWVIEGETLPRRNEDWRNEKYAGESVGGKTSLLSEVREWSENSSGRDSALIAKKDSIKGLSDTELEKVAHLQLKLMAEMEGKAGKVDYLPERECGHPKSEEKNGILQGYKLERNTAHSSYADEDKRCHLENEPYKLNSGGLMVLKSNFEEVHMLTRNNRVGATGEHKSEPKEENWYEDYLKNVNRRKVELRNRFA
ncbi:unnamed protein product [Angiostrongylus costaricensis]|uniref:Uncharacterized protein n=1 Tax=Angiostrongylus costaricensis TaxID=334426 RepID=A0A0R3PVG2_ANGCS|nr:unnamed protein product [Angiostrongylus costaricensis]